MKKIITFTAAFLMAALMAGCGNADSSVNPWKDIMDQKKTEQDSRNGDVSSAAEALPDGTEAAGSTAGLTEDAAPAVSAAESAAAETETSKEPKTTQKEDSSGGTETSSPGTAENKEEFPSNEQAKMAVKELFEKAYQYAKEGNREGFASLYADADKMSDTVNEDYNGFAKLVKKNYPDFDSTIMFGKDGYYIAYVINSVSSVSGNNTSAMWENNLLPVSYKNGEWRFDFSEKAAALQNDEGFWSFLPKPAHEAIKAGRDGTFFDTDKNEYYWVNEDIVIPKLVQGKVYIVWKNEDGSLSVFVNFNNGSDAIKVFRKGSIKISVDDIGDVLDVTFDPDVALAPGTCTNKVFTFSADQLKNNSGWGGRGVHCERVFIF